MIMHFRLHFTRFFPDSALLLKSIHSYLPTHQSLKLTFQYEEINTWMSNKIKTVFVHRTSNNNERVIHFHNIQCDLISVNMYDKVYLAAV